MNIEKLIQITAFILYKHNKKMPYLNLIKIAYLADRKSYERIGHSMTGDFYYSLPNGPILSTMLDLINNKCTVDNFQSRWNSVFFTSGYNIFIGFQNLPCDLLSRFEEKTLLELCEKYKDFTYSQMINEVHSKAVCPEWERVNPHSRKPITEKAIFRALGFSQSESDRMIAENAAYKAESEYLCKK